MLRAARRVWAHVRPAWPLLRWLLGLALLAVAIDVLASHGGELSGVGTVLAHLRWWWLVAALGVEAVSAGAFVVMEQRLLSAGGLRPPIGPLVGVTLASQALTNSVPAGPAVAAVYGFRWYRRFGADDALSAWALVGTSIAAALSLALLAAVGLVLATEEGASLDLVPAVLGVLAATAVCGVLFVYERPLASVVSWLLRLSHRLVGRPRGDRERYLEQVVQRVTVVRLGDLQALAILGWGFGAWLFDCACFGLAFLATGSAVPWKGLLLAYGAGQLAANLPITPGGLGAVEGSITIALSYFGGATTADIAAVLVYRLVSFWLALVVGWAAWGALALAVRRGRWARSAREAPVEAGVLGVGRPGAGAWIPVAPGAGAPVAPGAGSADPPGAVAPVAPGAGSADPPGAVAPVAPGAGSADPLRVPLVADDRACAGWERPLGTRLPSGDVERSRTT